MISSVEELLACLSVAKERKLSASNCPELTLNQLGLPLTYDVSSKDLETLKPIYTHVLKDIRENGKQSIFLEKILNSHQENNVDEAILMLFFFEFPDIVRHRKLKKGLNENKFELLDIANEIASNSILANFARDSIKNFDLYHAVILNSTLGILRIEHGRSKKFIKREILRCGDDVKKGFWELRADLAKMLSVRTDINPQMATNSIPLQASLLKIVCGNEESAMKLMVDAPHKEEFIQVLKRDYSHLEPYEHYHNFVLLGFKPNDIRGCDWDQYVEKMGGPAPVEEKVVEHTICERPGCNKIGSKICAGCKLVSYCGRECQVQHWKMHKKNCKKVKKVDTSILKESGKARKIYNAALKRQDQILAEDSSLDYTVVTVVGEDPANISFRDPMKKIFFRKLRQLAPDYPTAVVMMYEMLIFRNGHDDKNALIRAQLMDEYGLDPLDQSLKVEDISSELTDDECAVMIEFMKKSNVIQTDDSNEETKWSELLVNILKRLGIEKCSQFNLQSYREGNLSSKAQQKEENKSTDGNWSYEANGMMAAFDSYWFKDLDRKSATLKASDVAVLSKEKIGITLATLKNEGLHLASGIMRRIFCDEGYPPYVRVSRLDQCNFSFLLSKKKEGNALFTQGKYEEAIEQYNLALFTNDDEQHLHFFVAPQDQVNEIVTILSNQAECYLRMKAYKAAGQTATSALVYNSYHEKSRMRRAKAEIFLYEEEGSIPMLIQADSDLDHVMKSANASNLAWDAAEPLSKKVKEYIKQERKKLMFLFDVVENKIRENCF
ncbi:hypothetical protein CTEN210_06648 [Chaetoceros tenuissimus]|uniref:MYND-type domain-containing protein n=1 Tax=Chaetoceros tenuissimus TaxID=426638 RepID=A0AAD3CQ89_9STRA|nr:hypothetical protein CTEN210_06648 [Chaetoceros tenuissimus]